MSDGWTLEFLLSCCIDNATSGVFSLRLVDYLPQDNRYRRTYWSKHSGVAEQCPGVLIPDALDCQDEPTKQPDGE